MKYLLLAFSLLLFTNGSLLGQVILTQETFNEANNSTSGFMTGGEPWNVTAVNSCSGPAVFSVQTFAGVNRAFKEAGATGFGCCFCVSGVPDPTGTCGDVSNFVNFGPINISNRCNVGIKATISSANPVGVKECYNGGAAPINACLSGGNDQLLCQYSLDGGPWTVFGFMCGDNLIQTANTGNVLTGNTLSLRFMIGSQTPDEIYWVDDIQVSYMPKTTPTFTQLGPYCVGQSPATLPSTSIEGTAGTWSPSTINTAMSGSTIYTFTPTNVACFNPTTMSVVVNANTTPNFAPIGPLCKDSNAPLLANVSPNGINGTWIPNVINTGSIGSTNYVFTPDAGICALTQTLNVTITAPVTPTFTPAPLYCEGDMIPPLPTTSNNGFTGTWSPAINNTMSTVYTFTPTVGLCATTTTLAVNITMSTIPTFNAIPAQCAGGANPLPGVSTNGVTGTWSPAFDPNASATYTFTPTIGLCATTTTLTISITMATIPTFNAIPAQCAGGANPLPGVSTNGVTGTWSPAFDPNASATYTFTPTAGLCATTTTLAISITMATIPTFNAIPAQCAGGANPLPGVSTNGVTGTWSPAFDPNASATYTFTPTAGLCATTTTLAVNITMATIPTFTQPPSYCSGAAIPDLPTTSNNGITGVWTPAINNTMTTIYTFTSDVNQCAVNTTLTININNNTIPTFTQPPAYCSGAAIPDLPTTSNNGITGVWTPAINNTMTTIYTFTPDANQCAVNTNLTININNNTIPTFTQPPAYCSGAAIPNLPTTSNNGITGVWTPAINNTMTTIYTFTSDVNQCAVNTTLTININNNTIPTFTQPPAYCSGAAIPNLPTTSNNGITGVWTPAINNTMTTIYTFTSDVNQCAVNTTLTININNNTIPTFTQPPAYCSGAAIPNLPTTSNNGITGVWTPAINNTMTTIYTFTADINQCAVNTTLTININNNTIPTFTQPPAYCSGAAIPDLPTTSNNGITGAWTPAINNTMTTIYTFTSDINQCAVNTTLTININNNIIPTFTQPPAYCSGAAIPDLPTTSNNGITGAWTPAINNTMTTIYTFTSDINQCAVNTTLTININNNIIPTFTQPPADCSGAAIPDLPTTSNNGITGAWTPAINNTMTTIYTFTPDINQCAVNTTLTITITNIIVNIDPVLPLCISDPGVALNATPFGGSWSGPGISGNNFDPMIVGPGNHNVIYTVTDANNCIGFDNITIQVLDCACPDPAIADAGPNLIVCGNQLILLNGSVTTTPHWTTSGTGFFDDPDLSLTIYNPTPADIASGSVSLTLTASDPDGAGPCSPFSDQMIVTFTNILNVTADPVAELCSSGTPVVLTGHPAGGSWTGPGITGNTFDPGMAGLGSFILTYSVSNGPGCNGSDNITVNVVDPPSVTLNSLPDMCVGDPGIVLSNGSPAGGSYYLNGDFANPITIFIPTVTGPQTITYIIGPPECSNMAFINFNVNNCGCTNPATADAGPDQSGCAGQNFILTGNITVAATSLWTSNGDGNFINSSLLNTTYIPGPNDLIIGTIIITLTTEDPDGAGPCIVASNTMTITIVPPTDITIENVADLCNDDDIVDLTAQPTGGTFYGSGVNGDKFDPKIAGTGKHKVFYRIGTVPCVYIDSIEIEVLDCDCAITVTINAGPDTMVCQNSPVQIYGSITGVPGGTWTTNGSGIFSNSSSSIPVYTPSGQDVNIGNVIVTYTSDDPDGAGPCNSVTDQKRINFIAKPDVLLLVSQPSCVDLLGTLKITILAGQDLQFSVDNGASYTTDLIIEDLPPATYQLIVKNANIDCQSTLDFTIAAPVLPEATWEAISAACSDQDENSFILETTSNMTLPYEVTVNGSVYPDITSLPVTFDQLAFETYDVIITDAKGCKVENQFVFTQSSSLELDVNAVYIIDKGESVELTTNITGTYSTITWTPGLYLSCDDCINPISKPDSNIIYTVRVSDAQGCSDEATIEVRIRKTLNVFIPNVISPNHDGINDHFTVFTDDNIKQVKTLRVFNRWGGVLFERNNFEPNNENLGWDGTFKGQELNPNVYVYFAEVELQDGEIKLFKGDVTLIR